MDKSSEAPKESVSSVNGDSTPLIPVAPKSLIEQEHPLQAAFTFWIDKNPSYMSGNYGENIKKIGTVSTVEGFWGFYNHIKRPGDITITADYHLFREGIRPLWEDPANINGGRWKFKIKRPYVSKIWEDLQFAVIGERFDVGDEICGITVSCKVNDYIFKLWTKGASEEVRKRINIDLTDLIPPGALLSKIDFQLHQASREYGESKRDKNIISVTAVQKTEMDINNPLEPDLLQPREDPIEMPVSGTSSALQTQIPPDNPGSTVTNRWEVKNFLEIKDKKVNGPLFEAGGIKWSILVFPRGNRDYPEPSISIYLDVFNPKSLPIGWEKNARFLLTLVNQKDPEKSIHKDSHHLFCESESDWGFGQFEKLSVIKAKDSGFLVNGTLIIEVSMEIIKTVSYNWSAYDSKSQTGYVGLRNQGATCYMNSLLQTLFHTPKFRKAVYKIPSESDMEKNTIPFALQRVFYHLQISDHSVATKELTKSFGWEGSDSFVQHDVQELNRVLSDNLEQKMKGTPSDGVISSLFEGKTENYIKCINVEFESKREESFYDLSLNVKGCKGLYESFDKYIEEEILDGENKYQAEGHGLQDAKKGVRFTKLPPVLHIQLKRFEYDPYRDAMVKVNDRFEFPLDLDLNKYLDSESSGGVSQVYSLHGVLVHAGDVHGGHYYAFLRPKEEAKWFKFDDDRVTTADEETALEENFGGEQTHTYTYGGKKHTSVTKKFANAYMLVYFRKQDYADLLCEVNADEIDAKVREHFDKELADEEFRRKEKAEAHLYMNMKIVTDDYFKAYDQLGLLDLPKIKEIKVKRNIPIKEFKKTVEDIFGVPADRQRFWNWNQRQNNTFRICDHIPKDEETKTLDDFLSRKYEKILYVEEADPESLIHVEEKCLVFFKKFDAANKALSIIGHGLFRKNQTCGDFVQKIHQLDNSIGQKSIVLYEEVSPNNILKIDPEATLEKSSIFTGDIVVYYPIDALTTIDDTNPIQEHCDYILNKITVEFRLLSKPKDIMFHLDLSKKYTFDQVVDILGKKLEANPAHIRLTGHNSWNEAPKHEPIKRTERLTLNDMIYHHSYSTFQGQDIFYYEILEVALKEFDSKKNIKIHWMSFNGEETEYTLFVPKGYAFQDLEGPLRQHVTVEGTGKIRFVEIWSGKISKVFLPSDKIAQITDFIHIRAEEIPQDELDVKPNSSSSKIVTVHHIQNTAYHICFGNPINVVVKKGETVANVKARVQKRLNVPEDQIPKWKAAILTQSKVEYIEEDTLMFDVKYDEARDFFGFDHPAPKSATKTRVYDKPIRIYN